MAKPFISGVAKADGEALNFGVKPLISHGEALNFGGCKGCDVEGDLEG